MFFEYDDIVMSNEDMRQVTEDEMERMTPETVINMLIDVGKDIADREPDAWSGARRIDKIGYVARETYMKGFVMALYLVNESMKMVFGERSETNK